MPKRQRPHISESGNPAIDPLLLDGQLWLSMMFGSTKAHDLVRDPRILVPWPKQWTFVSDDVRGLRSS